ncbi:uncharacterized protein V6R79_020786 [Siganus canaliculatus]
MRQPLLIIGLSLAVLLSTNVLAQEQVQIQFQTDPLLVQTGTDIVFIVQTVSDVLVMEWKYEGLTLGLWTGGNPVINPVPQFQGRVTISATQLRIGSAQLRDAGTYTVEVTPTVTTGLDPNSRSIQLSVFDAVAGVSLFVPTVAVEGRNVSLSCTWTAGTEVTVQWGKGGVAVTADSRITIDGGSLVINPARRGDAGEYTCTVSNPVSAQTARESLTVYYGPDTPVLTKDAPKDCVGGGDVLVGQTVRLTCTSESLPPALFSWQRDGQPVASGQPDSGVLSLQTFSTDESGRYVCTARNSITGNSSEQETLLTIVDTCLNAGEVVGIVIGSVLLLIIIVLLILLIVCLVRRRRVQQSRGANVFVQKTNPNPRPTPPEPNGARHSGQGPNPPLYHANGGTRRPDNLYIAPPENNQPPMWENAAPTSATLRHNDRSNTNRLLHESVQNHNSSAHNGIVNPAFTHADAPNTQQQQNPNILIQTGGGAQQPAVHLSLNALPQNAQQNNNNAHMPTIHVNLNSFSSSGQPTQQDNSFPLNGAATVDASQPQQNFVRGVPSDPRMQSGPSVLNEAGHQVQAGPIPTGYTHYNDNAVSQRNANTQTYQQEPESRRRSDRTSRSRDTTTSSTRRLLPWDFLRATPSYPNNSLQRRRTPPRFEPDSSDSTSDSLREEHRQEKSQPHPQSQTASWGRAPPRQDALSADRQTRSRSADLRIPNTRSVTQLEAAHHTQRGTRAQKESAQPDIRSLPASQTASRQEAARSTNPQARPLMSQQFSVGHTAVSQAPMTQQGLVPPQGADTRALADPNHLAQTHMAQQHRAAPVQKPVQAQPVTHGANQPSQGGTAPVPSSHPPPSNLTQAALRAHTARTPTFQDRKQQTQAALLHPGPQTRAPAAAGTQHPPIPPPVIPLTEFQTLPKKRSHHQSPVRGPQPPRPPMNIPVAQRHLQAHQPPAVQHHPAMMPAHRHHHPGNGHVHGGTHKHAHGHARGHGHPSHPRQQQTHRGRPR